MMLPESNSEKSVSYQKKDGRGHARPSFFWYDNDKDLKVCFLVMCVVYATIQMLLNSQIHFLLLKTFMGKNKTNIPILPTDRNFCMQKLTAPPILNSTGN